MTIPKRLRTQTCLTLIALLLILSGCYPIKRVVWSPDGKLAAVLGEQGMYLCDADGKISGLLVSNVTVAVWFSDSARLALGRTLTFNSWNDVAPFLSAESRVRIQHGAQTALDKFKAGLNKDQVSATLTDLTEKEKSAAGIYLKGIDGAKQILGTNWNVIENIDLELSVIQIGTVTNGKVTLEPILARDFDRVMDIRISPKETALAYTLDTEANGRNVMATLKVAPLDGGSPVQLVAEQTTPYPDWSADGRSLLYVRAVGDAATPDELRLSSLSRRGVLNQSGQVDLQQKPDDLAGLLFNPVTKVRCLPDGRIIFSAFDVHLPSTSVDMPERQQLFMLDPERQATLTPLIPLGAQNSVPADLSCFEISPDGKHISIADKLSTVVLNVSAGTVEVVATNTEFVSVPTWRTTNELSFITGPETNNPSAKQVALWSIGKTRIISSNWPTEVREKFLDPGPP